MAVAVPLPAMSARYAEREGNSGEVCGVATTPELRDELAAAGVEIAPDVRLVDGRPARSPRTATVATPPRRCCS